MFPLHINIVSFNDTKSKWSLRMTAVMRSLMRWPLPLAVAAVAVSPGAAVALHVPLDTPDALAGSAVVYVNRAANSHWLQTRYDQPIDHLNGGADDAIRPGVLSRHRRCPHAASCLVSLALAWWQGRTRGHENTSSQARPHAVCGTHAQALV